ncbi:TBC1 domain family member 12-like [Glandiceps talaboti]
MNSLNSNSGFVANTHEDDQEISETDVSNPEKSNGGVGDGECVSNECSVANSVNDPDTNMTLKNKDPERAVEPQCNSDTNCNDIGARPIEGEHREQKRTYEASYLGNSLDNHSKPLGTPVVDNTKQEEGGRNNIDESLSENDEEDVKHVEPSDEHSQDEKPESERYDNFDQEEQTDQRVVPGSDESENDSKQQSCQESLETAMALAKINANESQYQNGSSCSSDDDEGTSDSKSDEDDEDETVSYPSNEGGHLPRTGTETSLQSDTSVTSVSSLSTEPSSSISTEEPAERVGSIVIDTEEAGFVEVSLSTRNSYDPSSGVFTFDEQVALAQGAKPKKKGLPGFLSRGLFSKKAANKEVAGQPSSPPGWKLFGRIPSKEVPPKSAAHISEEYQAKGKTHPPTTSKSWKKRMSSLRVASSTTALILENRPINLPAKSPEEEQKHKLQYEEMVKLAKKKEYKVEKQKLKKMAERVKYEENIASSLIQWNTEILPNWETMKNTKRTRDLWWSGVPPGARGDVWLLAIGNELNITHELFEIFKARAKSLIKALSGSDSESEEVHAASKESSIEVIKLDVNRTFPQLCIFQKGGPYHDILGSILGAYACYRPDVGYVQGMSFIAAVFLLNLEPADAFICFANLLNKSCQLSFFRLDELIMKAYFATYEEYFADNLPELFVHFNELNVTPDLYIIDWMYTIYSKSLPLDVACRVWDVFFRDGEEFLFRTALGILHMYQDVLLKMDFIHIAQFLTKLPENIIADNLFVSIAAINMQQKMFAKVFVSHLNAVQNANSKD